MQPYSKGISVIVCCYNSAVRLPRTLEHIARQHPVPGLSWELILVDNGSEDDTSRVAAAEWEKWNRAVSFSLVSEPVPGLIHARKRGIQEARFDLLLFCDDDNWLDPDYLRYADERMRRDENIAVLGGRSTPCFGAEKPDWFDRFQKYYAVGEPLPVSGSANARKFIAGAGMVVRRSVLDCLEELGFQNRLTGRKGKELLCGEDSEWCLAALYLGVDLYYDSRLQLTHFLEPGRLHWDYCVRMVGQSYGSLQVYQDLYRYIHESLQHNGHPSFEEWYAQILRRNLQQFWGEWAGLRRLLRTGFLLMGHRTGSMKEIQLRANLLRIRFLRRYKNKLHGEFTDITELVSRILAYRETVPSLPG